MAAGSSAAQVAARFWATVSDDPYEIAGTMAEIFAPDFRFHNLPYGETRNLEATILLVAETFAMLAGTTVTVEEQTEYAPDLVLTRLRVSFPAQHAATPPPAGAATLDYEGVSISRVSGGLIRETWLLWDARRAENEMEPEEEWRWPPWR